MELGNLKKLNRLSNGDHQRHIKSKRASQIRKISEVNFLVDSGAVYSLVPGKILDQLDIEPYKEMSFSLADGTVLKRKVCSAYFELEGEGGPAPVVYGEVGDEPLLGATTLESLGLVFKSIYKNITSYEDADG
jgi:clan AA aspartic protease